MDVIPPYLNRLIGEKSVPCRQIPARDSGLLRPLFDGGILEVSRVGRGEVVRVVHEQPLLSWVKKTFPAYQDSWNAPAGAHRAQAIALRRDSKAGGAGVEYGVLHLRSLNSVADKIWLNDNAFPVAEMTANHGLASCLIGEESRLVIEGRVALIENLECFLKAEAIFTDVSWVLNSAGRISDRLIACLKRSRLIASPLIHFPDYDPVGLSDYLRLRAALGDDVELWLPPDLEHRFEVFGNRELIAKKPRNRENLEKLGGVDWPCAASERVYRLIAETGSGLEQESLWITQQLKAPDGTTC